ncbi:UvrD-helicase domain-containing protein [Methylocystis parvus]|nr:UvrD-helicase domain-containing protein [Methylocystis parvus]WBK02213.1 UvrD-helicase domain-containing protein [Methylocystis parvus OBBP]
MNDKNGSHTVGIATASAGTGKTYDLTSRIEAEIEAGRAPERIVASTFTVKAAGELRERARQRLIGNGNSEAAVRLLGARINTINGVSGGLVKEFAFGLGLSPIVDVIDEGAAATAFRQAADVAIGRRADELGRLSRLFGYDEAYVSKDWRADVNRIVELSRANNIASEALANCAERSIEGFTSLLSPVVAGETEAGLDAALRAAIDALLSRYPTNEGLTKGTIGSLQEVREIVGRGRIEDWPWSRWAKLSKASGTKVDDPYFVPVREAASAFARHPRLLDQATRLISGLFACAAEAMRAYEAHKRSWGLVDFVDQDRLLLELLGNRDLEIQLRDRIESVFVDEFQDTSPLQLANFVAMSRIARSSVWVGDPKQAIYGFRGTDPDLITHVAPKIQEATGGTRSTLHKNWRSRPGLVAFFNDAFGPTFDAMGLPPEATRIAKVERDDLPGQGTALAVWRIEREFAASVVSGVVDALAEGTEWRVARDSMAEPLAPGDIAILCRTNGECLGIADALATAGMKVAIERGGLFGTLEARLAIAALRWCADRRDTVALAELAHLLHEGHGQPAWFEASLRDDRVEAIEALVPLAADLRAIADKGVHKTPVEFMDSVFALGGVAKSILRWGNAQDRLLNLEALRGLVTEYQEDRHRNRAPTTATDLCAWLEEQEANQPKSRALDAVTVMTYHASKGLEWPFVVLTSLDAKPKANAFGLHVASDVSGSEIDWSDPLAGRWLRYWPWPFGAQKKDVFLDTTAANSDAGRTAERSEREERARLLYVGATRARDYLILALPRSKSGWAWLDELQSDAGGSALAAPELGCIEVKVNGNPHAVRVYAPSPLDESASADPIVGFSGPEEYPRTFPPLTLKPSEGGAVEDTTITEEIDLGARLPFAGSLEMDRVGEAIHRFLAADNPAWDEARRVVLAKRQLDAWGVMGLDPRDVVTMGSRFRRFVEKRWPGAVLKREAPIVYRIGDRTMSGRIDAVAETPDVIVVFDHKSFPGAPDKWLDQAKKHAGQLQLYREAIAASLSTPKQVILALHLPISGEVLMVGVRDRA